MSDLHLTEFLRYVANLIESSNLSQDKLQKVGEFYMSYKMLEVGKLGKVETGETGVGTVGNLNEFSTEDITKFIVMGWYVYSLSKNTEID